MERMERRRIGYGRKEGGKKRWMKRYSVVWKKKFMKARKSLALLTSDFGKGLLKVQLNASNQSVVLSFTRKFSKNDAKSLNEMASLAFVHLPYHLIDSLNY